MAGRIWFPGNPWPDGHAVEDFGWWGRIHPDGTLWFELSLRTEDYGVREPASSGEGDWRSPVVWNNHHRCTLEPGWRRGLPAAEPGRPFRLAVPQTLTADPVDEVDFADEPAFSVHLLGHDATAGHEVTFTPRRRATTSPGPARSPSTTPVRRTSATASARSSPVCG